MASVLLYDPSDVIGLELQQGRFNAADATTSTFALQDDESVDFVDGDEEFEDEGFEDDEEFEDEEELEDEDDLDDEEFEDDDEFDDDEDEFDDDEDDEDDDDFEEDEDY